MDPIGASRTTSISGDSPEKTAISGTDLLDVSADKPSMVKVTLASRPERAAWKEDKDGKISK